MEEKLFSDRRRVYRFTGNDNAQMDFNVFLLSPESDFVLIVFENDDILSIEKDLFYSREIEKV